MSGWESRDRGPEAGSRWHDSDGWCDPDLEAPGRCRSSGQVHTDFRASRRVGLTDLLRPRTVADAEAVWRVIKHPAGWSDDDELEVKVQPRRERHPSQPIRIGVPKRVWWDDLDDMPDVISAFSAFVDRLSLDPRFHVFTKDVVNITAMTSDALRSNVSTVTAHELKVGINHYLQTWTEPSSPIQSLSEIINFNLDHRALELPAGPFAAFGHEPRDDESYADQSFLLKADALEEAGWKNATYRAAKETLERVGWTEEIGRAHV